MDEPTAPASGAIAAGGVLWMRLAIVLAGLAAVAHANAWLLVLAGRLSPFSPMGLQRAFTLGPMIAVAPASVCALVSLWLSLRAPAGNRRARLAVLCVVFLIHVAIYLGTDLLIGRMSETFEIGAP